MGVICFLPHLSPPHELVFAGKKDSDVFCTLTLKNMSQNSTAYKVSLGTPVLSL